MAPAPKRFEVHLASQTDEHYRTTRLQAESEDAARAFCERAEYALCAYQMPHDEWAQAVAAEKDGSLKGALKGRLHAHRQDKPYLVEKITEIKGR